MKMNNVGLYISKFDYGGVSRFISNLDEALKREQINTHILTFSNDTKNDISILKDKFELVEYLKKNNVKTIITNGWFDHLKLYIICKLYRYRVKFIQVLHSDLSQLDMNNSSIKGKIKKELIKYSFNHSDVCVSVSKAVQKEINESGYFKKEFIQIYNPIIDEKANYSIKSEFVDIENKEEINLVMIGWIRRLKGQDVVIKALSKVKDKRIKLNIVGGIYEQDYYEEISSLIEDNNLEDRVKFFGVQDNAIDILKTMDILVLASKTEALPTVLVEALACEIPIISSDCKHGPREILDNGKYGILFDVNDYLELYKKIQEIISNNERYNSLKVLSNKRSKEFIYSNGTKKYKNIL